MKKKHWFRLTLAENVIRTMTREQYKAAMRWLRQCRNAVCESIG